MKRVLALVLALSLCLPLLPAFAEEVPEETRETVAGETPETEAPTEPEEASETSAETEELTEEAAETPAETEEPTEEEEPIEETAAAAEPEAPEEMEELSLPEEYVFINPLYEDVLTEADIPAAPMAAMYAAPEYTHYDTTEEASEAMRRSLQDREPAFEAEFLLDSIPVTADFMRSVYAGAVVHTGVPTEGDYMRYEFGGFRGRLDSWTKQSDGRVMCQYTFTFLYYTTAEQEAELDGEVSRVLSKLGLDGKDNKEKIDAIYGYLCRNVTYDSKNLNDKAYTLKYTAYAALMNGTAVCQGYAAAFYRLCLEEGVDTRVISSKAMNHAWNIVRLGRFYYCLDATWDAGHDPYLYYLRGSEYWLENHVTNGVSTLGDQFQDGDFSTSYPLSKKDGDYVLTEDGTLILGESWGSQIDDFEASRLDGVLVTDAPWQEAAEQIRRIRFRDGTTYIGSNAFRGLRNLEELILPDTVETVEDSAFRDCASLESLTLPKQLRYIGSYAFAGCEGLKTLIFTGSAKPAVYFGAFSGDELTCLYPCTWASPPSGEYGGTVTWKGDHAPVFVERQEPTEEADGVMAHWRCSLCGKRFLEETCDTELGEEDVILYRETYRLFYRDMESGENPNPDSYATARGLTLQDPGRAGYLFGGWYLDEGCRERITAIPAGAQGDMTLYPKWTAIRYTLSFNANGGSGSASRRSLAYDVDTVLPDTVFRRRGYTLAGWNTAKDGTGKMYLPGQTARNLTETNKAAVTLYAQWSPNAYLLLLDPNDGVTEASSQELIYNEAWVLPAEAGERQGYHISGWNTRADGKGRTYTPGKAVKNLTTKAAGQVTLYGKWAVNTYKVLFHGNGANAKDRVQTMTYGRTTVLAANAFRRTGYVFRGWSDSPEGEILYSNKERVLSLTAEQGGIVDLYAVWQPITYRLAFKANGGQGTMESLECAYDQEMELPEPAFTRPGFTFLGWSTSASGKVRYEAGESVRNLTATQGRTVTLYARWQAHTYEIRFQAGEGAAGATKPMLRLSCGKSYTLTANRFKYPGHTFLGWSLDPAATAPTWKNRAKIRDLTIQDGEIVTLYAVWK